MMDLDIKKALLEELMKEMDDSVLSEIKGKKAEPVAIVKEEKSELVPMDKLGEKLKDVMGKADVTAEEPEMVEEEDEDDEDMGGSTNMMRQLMELKKAKAKE